MAPLYFMITCFYFSSLNFSVLSDYKFSVKKILQKILQNNLNEFKDLLLLLILSYIKYEV